MLTLSFFFFCFRYETENGISAQEEGRFEGQDPENLIKTVEGSYSYTAPDGVIVSVNYIADENGFRPQLRLETSSGGGGGAQFNPGSQGAAATQQQQGYK